jgi:serine protease Do
VAQKMIQVRRWVAFVSLLLVLVIGLVAGSWTTSKTSRNIPVFTAVNIDTSGDQVSFANGFTPVVQKAVPAVVNVSTSKVVRTHGASTPFFSNPFFQQFFGNPFGVPQERREHALGSGVIFSPDGYIITNNHVIAGATDVKVLLSDKREFQANIIGADPKTDIAVLNIGAANLPALPFGDSSKMHQGDFVIAIGNPFGLNQTVTMGIVSATGRGGLGIEDIEDFIQTDAAINPGNSGGALIDQHGALIGINTAILSGQGGGNEGIGFAIPINMARQVMDQILKHGKVVRAWLGVAIQPVTPEIAKAFGLAKTSGALVSDIESNSPASNAGLEKGDVILAVNGESIQTSRDLQLKIAAMQPGKTVKLKIFRNGSTIEVPVTLAEMPTKAQKSGGQEGGAPAAMSGVSVQELTPDIARQLQLPPDTKGVVVVQIDPASPAVGAGLQRGDVIERINREHITTVSQFKNAVQQAGKKPVVLLVNRGGRTMFLVVQP